MKLFQKKKRSLSEGYCQKIIVENITDRSFSLKRMKYSKNIVNQELQIEKENFAIRSDFENNENIENSKINKNVKIKEIKSQKNKKILSKSCEKISGKKIKEIIKKSKFTKKENSDKKNKLLLLSERKDGIQEKNFNDLDYLLDIQDNNSEKFILDETNIEKQPENTLFSISIFSNFKENDNLFEDTSKTTIFNTKNSKIIDKVKFEKKKSSCDFRKNFNNNNSYNISSLLNEINKDNATKKKRRSRKDRNGN